MFRTLAGVLIPCLILAGSLQAEAAPLIVSSTFYGASESDDGYGGNWDGDFPPYRPGFQFVDRRDYSENDHYGYATRPRFIKPSHRRRIAHHLGRCRRL